MMMQTGKVASSRIGGWIMYCTPLYVFAVGEDRYTAEAFRKGRNYPYVVAIWRGYPRESCLGRTLARPRRNERVGDAVERAARDFVAQKEA
jgi:hypothetical protein